ncbi:MAG: AI-2E family transporter [Nannocystaceae bacterium]|nr:AI-2E family transporter [Nannocystaceae bacterium]
MLRRFSRLWGFLAFSVFVVVLFRDIVLPFVFALLLAYLLAPMVKRMQPRIGRAMSVISLYLVIIGLFAAFFGFLVPAVVSDLAKLRQAVPEAVETVNREWLPKAEMWVEGTFGDFLHADSATPPIAEPGEIILVPLGDGSMAVDLSAVRLRVEQQSDGSWLVGAPPPDKTAPPGGISVAVRALLAEQTGELTSFIGPLIQKTIAGVTSFLTSLVITFMLAAFELVDVQRVNRFIRSLVPYDYRMDFEELWAGMDKGLSGVIRGQLLICLVNGALTFIGLVVFKIKYSFLLGLLAGAFSLIPIFGTIISSIPIVMIALVASEEGVALGPALGILAWISGIHLLEANVLNPKIIGDSAHIHPVIVIFALLGGEHVYGLTGALLAVPVASMVQTAFLQARRRSPVFNRESELRP